MSATELRVKELLREKGWTTKVLAEKTGMSESYLTHIKNGTRRWNEDALKKLAVAFSLDPVELFSQRKKRTDNLEDNIKMPTTLETNLQLRIVPIVGEIPSNPSPFNNQKLQVKTGHKESFLPVFNSNDENMFCLHVDNNSMAPQFIKGDYLVISPEKWVRSGDIAAIEYGNQEAKTCIAQISYMEDFIVLESVNHKSAPIALIKGKDNFRIIGKLIYRYQKFS